MARARDVAIDEVPKDVQPVYRRFADDYGPRNGVRQETL